MNLPFSNSFTPPGGATRTMRAGRFLAGLVVLFGLAIQAQAQWITQVNTLKPGWNAVYLHVDPDHAPLSDPSIAGLGGPIDEIWHWNPPLPVEQINSPQAGEQPSQWTKWKRSDGTTGQKLTGNGAYLVRVNNTVTSYQWRIKGKPVTPTYRWTLTGLNFVGFPTPPNTPPNFADFFQPAPELLTEEANLFGYQGGELGPANPMAISPFLAPITPVKRDQAYWARAGESYLQYFGPFQILSSDSAGIRFGAQGGQARFRLRNLVTNAVTVTLTMVPSESNPTNGPAPVTPPLLLRGDVNPVNLKFTYSDLAAPQQWTLAGQGKVGSEVEIILGLNRAAMATPAGTFYAGILRLTDSLGFSQVDVAVSAVKESTAGLWVGGAEVTNVNHYLTTYAQATNKVAFTNLLIGKGLADLLPDGVMQFHDGYRYEWDAESGRVLVFGGPKTNRGNYLVTSTNYSGGGVASSFPLRLIVHDSGGARKLLQQVYYGPDQNTNLILTTKESLLNPSLLNQARRISAVHLPLGTGPWPLTGAMQPGSSLAATVALADSGASNPFLHTYHPDHDNLDAQFNPYVQPNQEVYEVDRQLTLNFASPQNDFNSLTQGAQALVGDYREVLTIKASGNQQRAFTVGGAFALKRISDIPNLTN